MFLRLLRKLMEWKLTNNYWLKPVDLIAGVIILGGMVLLFCGKDGTIATMLLAVTAFYFGLHAEFKKSEA